MTIPVASNPQPGGQQASFRSWHRGAPSREELCVSLSRSPPSQPGLTRLHQLSHDLTFHYNPIQRDSYKVAFCADPSRDSATDEQIGSVSAEDGADTDLGMTMWEMMALMEKVAKEKAAEARDGRDKKRKARSSDHAMTATSINARARQMLRAWGFDLVSLGIASRSSPSQQPLSGVDVNPAPSLLDPSAERIFQLAALKVDSLLAALDRARTWSPRRLKELCAQVGATPEEVEGLDLRLRLLFGEGLAADFIIKATSPIGQSRALVGNSEMRFNGSLDETVISAANAILRLIGISALAVDNSLLKDDTTSTTEADRTAAILLVNASRLDSSFSYLRLVEAGSGVDSDWTLRGLEPEATASARPDWILVFGPSYDATLHGVIESEPHASPSSLMVLTARRAAPLATEDESAEPPVTAAESTGASSPVRKRARREAAPRFESTGAAGQASEGQRKRDIAARPVEPPSYGYIDSAPWQKLALQLSFQMLTLGVRNCLLWAHWAQCLLPAQLSPATGEDSEAVGNEAVKRRQYALVFAPAALHILAGAAASQPEEPVVLPGTDPSQLSPETLRFHGQPNLILGLVKWAIYAQEDSLRRGGLRSDGTDSPAASTAEDQDAEDERGEEDGGREGKGGDETGHSGRRSDLSGPPQHTAREPGNQTERRQEGGPCASEALPDGSSIPASSSTDSMAIAAADSSCSGTTLPQSSPPNSQIEAGQQTEGTAKTGAPRVRRSVRILPFARGTFADAHRGTIQRPGQAPRSCVYKFNRAAINAEDGRSLPEGYDTEQGGPVGRFQKELDVLNALRELQGTVLPRLIGTSRALCEGFPGSPPSLVLEDVGEPIDRPGAWPSTLPVAERRRLVEEAYGRLHEAGWLHGDVAARNILVSRPAEEEEEDGQGATARVCIIDLARASPCDPDSRYVKAERYELRALLDDIL